MLPSPKATFTPRETQILELICSGFSSKMIANTLMISPRTVEMHRANLMRKSGARNFAHLSHHASRLIAANDDRRIANARDGIARVDHVGAPREVAELVLPQ